MSFTYNIVRRDRVLGYLEAQATFCSIEAFAAVEGGRENASVS